MAIQQNSGSQTLFLIPFDCPNAIEEQKSMFDGSKTNWFYLDELCHWAEPLSNNPLIVKMQQSPQNRSGLLKFFNHKNNDNEQTT